MAIFLESRALSELEAICESIRNISQRYMPPRPVMGYLYFFTSLDYRNIIKSLNFIFKATKKDIMILTKSNSWLRV
jgi:hypothetical protein